MIEWFWWASGIYPGQTTTLYLSFQKILNKMILWQQIVVKRNFILTELDLIQEYFFEKKTTCFAKQLSISPKVSTTRNLFSIYDFA